MRDSSASPVSSPAGGATPSEARASFVNWFVDNYPSGCEIHDPEWHAWRIYARLRATPASPPREETSRAPSAWLLLLGGIRQRAYLSELDAEKDAAWRRANYPDLVTEVVPLYFGASPTPNGEAERRR